MSFPIKTASFILNKSPYKEVNYNLEAEDATFKLVEKEIKELKQGQVVVKTLYLSNDPTQRAWIQKGINPERMYVPPVYEGQTMRSSGLGKIVASKSEKFAVDQIVYANLKWQQYVVVDEDMIYNKVPNIGLPLTMFLDTLGMTGLTAYFGLLDVAKLKASDTIVISAASGATGSMCVQIAKHVIGCKKVIGISGGAEKCKFVESLGADICVDYKDGKFGEKMKAALGPDKYCDVYFDGVGGSILDTMLTLTKAFGTIVACGAIAGYNDYKKSALLNWPQIITNRLKVQGFIILDYREKYATAVADIIQWIKEGKIKANESTLTVVDLSDGKFHKIPETWGLLFSNEKGPGKLLTKL